MAKKKINIFAALAAVAVGVVGGIHGYMYWDNLTLAAGHVGHWFQNTFGFEVTHQYDEESAVVVDSTCTEKGSKTYTCRVCGAEKVEILELKPHNEETDAAVPATCTGTGLTEGKHCIDCGEVTLEQEVVEATGHDIAQHKQESTCTEFGDYYDYCLNCDYRGPSYTPPLAAHNYELSEEIAATCTVEGKLIYTCEACGATKEESVAATGHNYVDGVCSNCGEAEPVPVDNLASWTMPASEGYTVEGNKMTFAGTNELSFATKEKYNSISLTFKVSETQDVRGAFQIGWGAQTTDASINSLPFVQFNYDRAVLCLPDGTTYDTSWVTGENWRLTIDAENSNVVLSVDGEVVYNVDASWWTQDNWGLPGYLVLRAESNCALTFELTQMTPIV